MSSAVEKLLKKWDEQSLLRFSTAGSVDDGKSTLIGRLLHDSKSLFDDHLDSLKTKANGGQMDLSQLTDGLKAEREQGITIDVAYRYFSTPKRNFILADTPGHEQYTRNMATGASTSSLALLLIDSRNGLTLQTKRHAFISSMFGIPRMLVAINKMDLVDWSQERFEQIKNEFSEFMSRLEISSVNFIPVSALLGDNVVKFSQNTPWYKGSTVLSYLEDVYVGSDTNNIDFRMPVQYVIRPHQDYRGYAGQVASGAIKPQETVMVLPSGKSAQVKSIDTFGGELDVAFAPKSVVLTLDRELDISRGDMFVRKNNLPEVSHTFEAMVVWMSEKPLDLTYVYKVKHTTQESSCRIEDVRYRLDINELSRQKVASIELNDIARVRLTSSKPLFFDSYRKNSATGSFILIDSVSNATVAAGTILSQGAVTTGSGISGEVIERNKNLTPIKASVSKAERQERSGHKSVTVWMTGLSGAGKSSVAQRLERMLFDRKVSVITLDGDNLRLGINKDLSFSQSDRGENIRRTAEAAKLLNQAAVVVICCLISPFEQDRSKAREIVGEDQFIEVYVNSSLEVCESRDPKGLYKKARSGHIKDFTGIGSPYEPPTNPAVNLDTTNLSIEEATNMLYEKVVAVLKV